MPIDINPIYKLIMFFFYTLKARNHDNLIQKINITNKNDINSFRGEQIM
jgi:hypothetical protein